MFRFESPLWGFLFLIFPVFFFLYKYRKSGTFIFSDISFFKNNNASHKYNFFKFFLRALTLTCLIVAMMRPQDVNKTQEVLTRGIDIILAIDISGSMQSKDFAPKNRLDAAKSVVSDFIKGRKSDRIGMVIFSSQSFTQCPLTTDYGVLLELLGEVDVGQIEDGTAIGMAIATAVKRLKDSDAKSKVIILLTDGVNNTGKVDPLTAANLAKNMGIKVYTIGIGREGMVPFPVNDPIFGKKDVLIETKIDEELLRKISTMTGGVYFRAENEGMLRDVYSQIDSLEKTEIKTKDYFRYQEYFMLFLWLGLFFICLEILIFYILYPKFP